jgi:hypothetical protein
MVLFKIRVFDDGNAIYANYENIWELIEPLVDFPGKVSVQNKLDKTIIISSISYWKLLRI